MLTVSLALSLLITSVSDLIALCELPHENRRNRHIKRASNMCRLTQFITLANIRDIIYTVVHPAPFELVICRAFPAYILDEIKPCNLDLIKQFTWITGIYCSECLRPDNAVRNHANQILRYFDTVHSACPDPIDKDISYGLGFNFVSFPPIPSLRLKD